MSLLSLAISLYIDVLIANALMSWFPPSYHSWVEQIRRALHTLTDPVLRPLRQILPAPNFGGVRIDLSVWVAIIVLRIVQAYL